MSREIFRDILIDVFRGNVSEADRQVEQVVYDNTYNLPDEYARIRQDRANFDLAKLRRMCYNK